ncbi:MAG: proline dehydrogenase family protein [Anaerolineaceae bacterium]|jgi:proline dehydrogenase
MMRAFFITLSKLSWAQRLITAMPPAQRAAARFIAGETHADAIQAVRGLNARGMVASLDHLGENTSDEHSARQAAQEIVVILDAIEQNRVCANVSIKLSQLGLAFREELCRQNLVTILEKARSANNFIRIDMEDSTLTQKTLDTFFWARLNGYSHVGIVIQAYLYRSEADIRLLAESGAHVRLCKGAYKEPPHLAFPKIEDVNINFDRLAGSLLASAFANGMPEISADGRVPPMAAIATHDEKRIHFARQQAERLGLPKRAVEFQMLYGIRRDLQEKLAAQGYPVRVYVPYGKHWYPYFMRRLAERPANVWFLLSNVLRR